MWYGHQEVEKIRDVLHIKSPGSSIQGFYSPPLSYHTHEEYAPHVGRTWPLCAGRSTAEDGAIPVYPPLPMHGLADTCVPSQTCAKDSRTVSEGDRSAQRSK